MPRRPALLGRARLPRPLLADLALALVLAGLSLLTIETGRAEPGDPGPAFDTEILVSPEPIVPTEPVEIRVLRGGKPVPRSRVEPLLTIQNTTTGRWKTYVAKPTDEPGVYRVPAFDPGEGAYSYSVLYGPFEQNVTVNDPAAPRNGPERGSGESDSRFWAACLTLLATLPIALRRRWPLLVFLVTLSAAVATDHLYDSFQFAGALVGLYTVAAYVGRPGSIGVGAGTAVALPFAALDLELPELVSIFAIFAVAWIVGDRIGARRAYLRRLEERAVRLEQEREEHARRAAAEEQARIARELHDIVTHNVSVMTVQAAAAGDVFDTQPGRAREALASIESTGREALTELRRLFGRIRPVDGSGELAPLPGLARLEDLIAQVQAAGLRVHLTVEGEPQELPAGVDLSAYRIVQEALTNTLKHARASNASVLVRYGADEIEIEVVDDGRGPSANGAERGQGIIGMRERAALFGGELRVGSAGGQGFSIHARIPTQDGPL
jgi:signal transduction histidine kinase